ncbi:MAG: hypothetical protein Q9M94_02140 [Candidatus Gracilibacteria bacterium]|nr:hypothetical protein [Candidatus Gracilibacteria bacterium]MDQ7023330.1 hypothetical protein [Candidatus Gracilibacteria bacterium]
MTTATVLMPEGIKVDNEKAISLDSFFRLLYLNKENVEDFLDVKKAMKNSNPKFYNFDDIINEY